MRALEETVLSARVHLFSNIVWRTSPLPKCLGDQTLMGGK